MRKFTAFLFSLIFSAVAAHALISPGSADSTTAEGWHAVGFPVDDYVPWSLQFESKELSGFDRKYLVVFGYLVASPDSVILFPSEEASHSGRTDGTLILAREDSPAMRWLVSSGRCEGFYAVGGLFARSTKGPLLGHLTKIRFAMKREPIKSATATTPLISPKS